MASTFLFGLGLANFRGLPEKMQYIGPFREINFFIGPNNAGKSTILAFIARYLVRPNTVRIAAWARQYEPLDIRLGKGTSEVKFSLAVRTDDAIAAVEAQIEGRLREIAKTVVNALGDDGVIWLVPNHDDSSLVAERVSSPALMHCLDEHNWQFLWRSLTGRSGGSLDRDWIPQATGRILNYVMPSYPDVHFIPAIRQVGDAGSDSFDHSGNGLIEKLAELQNPPHDQREKRETFQKINRFLAVVTGKENSSIEIPFDRRHILVHMDGKVLPLSSLGTGVQEVIMIASFCTLLENQIVCVEEPEIHLHPLLQRKLVRYLRDNTSNQYFIATHSASMIDAVMSSVFSVLDDGGNVAIRLAVNPNERYEICRQLGYKASDLLQANAVIWVEGPSDRILINHWIHGVSPDLVEGLHYSIMFYGGRLLSHLAANDHEVDEFISLRRLNRNIFIVIDSDKKSANTPINATKKRIVNEFGELHCWVTKGREIENYVPASVVSNALFEQSSKFVSIADLGPYAHRLYYSEKSSKEIVKNADKVKLARSVAARPADYSELDLERRIDSLVGFIRIVNGF